MPAPKVPITPAPVAPAIEAVPAPALAPVQNITVNMVTPQAGEPTEGLSEIQKGGRFVILEPDPARPGKTIKKTVDAQGQPID